MSKFTQRDLLNEGLWNDFKGKAGGFARGVGETIKQVGKVVAPEIHDPLVNTFDTVRKARASIKDKRMPWPKRIERWVKEQGKFPVGEVIKLGKNPDGSTHFSVDVAEKGINRQTGEETIGRIHKEPHSVVAYDPSKEQYKWIIKPRSDSFKTTGSGVNRKYVYGDEAARRRDDDISSLIPPQQQQAPTQ